MHTRTDRRPLERIVVVGASLAGLRACEALRQHGFAGTVTLIGAETHRPYDRPPLSKKVLAGEWEPDRIALRQADGVDTLGLDLRLGTPAAGLDVDHREVVLADGAQVPFDGLVLATGAAPIRLPGQDDVDGVYELRTLDDSLALRASIADGTARVVVIGAGFIGLEVAATAAARGCAVTVLEAAPAPLVRGLGPELGAVAAAHHGEAGTEIRCGVQVTALRSGAVELADGSVVPADVVVVGVGVRPNTAWLTGSGLELRDGVVCDPTLAAAPGIYAAGDLARWPHGLFDEEVRIEHWTNAAEQGAAAATNLLAAAGGGDPAPYAEVPFFWSDQGRQRIQFLGRGPAATGADGDGDEAEIVVGSPASGKFLALYRRGDRLRGALGFNAPRLVMPYRALLANRATWSDARALATTQTP